MISINEAKRFIKRSLLANLTTKKRDLAITPLVSGKHGIGKSQMVKSIAHDLGGVCITIEGGTLKEGEITGLPYQYKDENGLYILSLNKDDDNYIGKLRVTVRRSGSACCLRVKIAFEWQSSDGIVAQFSTNIPYIFGDEWYDNRSVDYRVYYMGGDRSGKAVNEAFSLINGFDESKFDASGFEEGASVKVLI